MYMCVYMYILYSEQAAAGTLEIPNNDSEHVMDVSTAVGTTSSDLETSFVEVTFSGIDIYVYI